MANVIGVRFRRAGKIYFFDPDGLQIETGSHVIVETARGIEYGTVVVSSKEISEEELVSPLKKVIRIATEEDDEIERENKKKEIEAFDICKEKIKEHGLEMKLIDVEFTFDNNKIMFYFTAEGRIDFRELVKDLAAIFKTRIELRQIGVRDETKMMGSLGICGRSLCCSSFLCEFQPVSIKMAKDQNLSLNPTKISGVCGRLMCCLKYEEETYKEINEKLPDVGQEVTTPDGKGTVLSVNVLRQLIRVAVTKGDDETEVAVYSADLVSFDPSLKKSKNEDIDELLDEVEFDED
ncbi:MAG TPA: stage 0 sporulation family protein [Defluviitaleaceae bacterium]|nr:stage 0 sporulation family protein [Candidatus Epulonipiscium sp.]HOA79952.1 stage 0 sporulation family protein [Defluviitaleaceae bacterium]